MRVLVAAVTTIACLVFIVSASEAQAPAELTLAQAVAEALLKNPRLLDQHGVTEQSDLSLRLARNEFRPKVTPNVLGSFGQTNVDNQTYRVDVSQQFVTGTSLRVGTGTTSAAIPGQFGEGDIRFYNADTTLTLSQPLLRGFGRSVTRQTLTSAEIQREDADRRLALAEQQIALEVASAYYRIVSQQAFVEIARQSFERATKLREASAARLQAGLVSELDVLRANELVVDAENQLLDAQSMAEDARDQLTTLMGRTSSEPFAVHVEIPRYDTAPIGVEAATSIALANRLDLKGQAAERANTDIRMKSARNQLLPQVDVNFALTRRQTSNSFTGSFRLNGFQFATFFTVAMPVDRTAQRIAYQATLIERDRQTRAITTMERQVADEVKRGVRERSRLTRGLTSAESSVAIATKEVEIAQLRYERGLSNNLDVVTAEGHLLAAEARRVQALADAAVAELRFYAMLGTFNPRTDIAGAPATR